MFRLATLPSLNWRIGLCGHALLSYANPLVDGRKPGTRTEVISTPPHAPLRPPLRPMSSVVRGAVCASAVLGDIRDLPTASRSWARVASRPEKEGSMLQRLRRWLRGGAGAAPTSAAAPAPGSPVAGPDAAAEPTHRPDAERCDCETIETQGEPSRSELLTTLIGIVVTGLAAIVLINSPGNGASYALLQ